MSEDKLLHISCMVKQANVHDLLLLLEAAKVGNVEVRAVKPLLMIADQRAGKQRNGKKKMGVVQPKVRAAMAIKQKRAVREIAEEIGEKSQSVMSAITVMLAQGVAKRVGYGIYMRIKPDPQPNGAAA